MVPIKIFFVCFLDKILQVVTRFLCFHHWQWYLGAISAVPYRKLIVVLFLFLVSELLSDYVRFSKWCYLIGQPKLSLHLIGSKYRLASSKLKTHLSHSRWPSLSNCSCNITINCAKAGISDFECYKYSTPYCMLHSVCINGPWIRLDGPKGKTWR